MLLLEVFFCYLLWMKTFTIGQEAYWGSYQTSMLEFLTKIVKLFLSVKHSGKKLNMFKDSNRNTRKRCKICSKLTEHIFLRTSLEDGFWSFKVSIICWTNIFEKPKETSSTHINSIITDAAVCSCIKFHGYNNINGIY